jgi:hypothetical protein
MIVGLLINVIYLQWWVMRPMVVDTHDLNDPDVQRALARRVVELVVERFGESQARQLREQSNQFVELLLESMRKDDAPRLMLVP